jgi:Zn finger protein HypA/HybF involved in hydrogenase expression
MPKIISNDSLILKAKNIHGEKFEYLGFEVIKQRKYFLLKCNDCDYTFKQYVYSHLKGISCPKCAGNVKLSISDIIQRGDTEKYEYIELLENNRIKIKCKKCNNIFTPSIDNHLNKNSGCPKCAGNYNFTLDEIKEKGISIHGDKYFYLDIIHKNKVKYIKLKCKKCNHIFNQIVDNHLNKLNGCIICKSASKGVEQIEKYLVSNSIKYIREKSFDDCKHIRKLFFDFYLPEQNILIEFNGRQHYEPVNYFGGKNKFENQKIKDDIKVNFCSDKNIKLLIISYKETKNIPTILFKIKNRITICSCHPVST